MNKEKMNEELLSRPAPPPPIEESRLMRQVHRISISHSVSVTYAIILSLASLLTIIITLFVSNTLPLTARVWMGSVIGVLLISLQIMLCIYARDPVFAVHFVSLLMLMTGVGFALSALHFFV